MSPTPVSHANNTTLWKQVMVDGNRFEVPAGSARQGLNRIEPGQKVLISGASGGAGTFAVQLAKLSNTEVTGVCRRSKMDYVHSIGADHVIDYTQEDFTQNGQQYDLIIDMMNRQHSLLDYMRILSTNGRLVIVGGADLKVLQIAILGPLISLFSKRSMGLLLHKANKGLETMIQLLAEGKIVPVIDKVFPLNEAAEAMRYFGEGKAQGKVVITVGEKA
jgi:NADPH:quinone reductase-like Zn-dependent oxidoreductase